MMSDVANTYTNLEIRILERQDVAYPVEITLNEAQALPRGFLPADLLPWRASGAPQSDGKHLFDTLLADQNLRDAWVAVRGQPPQKRVRVRLRLDENASELHALPWELLHDGRAYIAAHADTPFFRYLPRSHPQDTPVTERPIRVLAAIANPKDLHLHTPLDVNAERKSLRAACERLDMQIALEFLDAPITLERLEEGLKRCHILHFTGHGAFSQRHRRAALYLQDRTGNTQMVSETELVDMLQRQSPSTLPRLVVLSACQSALRSTRRATDAFTGLATHMVHAGIPAVVAMQDKITIESARTFQHAFYTALAQHGLVDVAMNYARDRLLTRQRSDAGVPVLFMRLRDGHLFAPAPHPVVQRVPSVEQTRPIHLRPRESITLRGKSYLIREVLSRATARTVARHTARASDIAMARNVALCRVMTCREAARTQAILARFIKRAQLFEQAARHCDHLPHVYDVIDAGPHTVWIIDEWIGGAPLETLMPQTGALPDRSALRQALRWAGDVCEALSALHQQRLGHHGVSERTIYAAHGPRGAVLLDPHFAGDLTTWLDAAPRFDATVDIVALAGVLYRVLTHQPVPTQRASDFNPIIPMSLDEVLYAASSGAIRRTDTFKHRLRASYDEI